MSRSTTCRSNLARLGKKSDKFTRPSISTMFETAVLISATRLLYFASLSDVFSQSILVRTFASVENAISRTLTFVPILLNIFDSFSNFILSEITTCFKILVTHNLMDKYLTKLSPIRVVGKHYILASISCC